MHESTFQYSVGLWMVYQQRRGVKRYNWCNISSMHRSTSSPDETPRRELKMRLAAEYFWRTSRCFIWWWNTVSKARYYFSNKRILDGEIKGAKIHRIHKWRTRGKKLVPSHESEALEDKQKFQMKTFSELPECLARIPPKITLYGLLFKYSYVGCLLFLMFSNDLLFAIKRDEYICKETGWFCRFPKHQKQDTTSGRWLEKSGKLVSPASHCNRIRKPDHYNSVKQK